MVKVYDPQKNLRFLQNTIILTSLYGSIIGAICYVSAVIGIFVIEGSEQVLTLFSLNIIQQLSVTFQTTMYYFKLFHANVGVIGIQDYNYFLVKCASTMMVLPVLTTTTLGIVFRKKIVEKVRKN